MIIERATAVPTFGSSLLEQEPRKLGDISPRGNTVTCHRRSINDGAAADLLGDVGIAAPRDQEQGRLAESDVADDLRERHRCGCRRRRIERREVMTHEPEEDLGEQAAERRRAVLEQAAKERGHDREEGRLAWTHGFLVMASGAERRQAGEYAQSPLVTIEPSQRHEGRLSEGAGAGAHLWCSPCEAAHPRLCARQLPAKRPASVRPPRDLPARPGCC
jgi:hypothetical protein